jgi:hypothetical protein
MLSFGQLTLPQVKHRTGMIMVAAAGQSRVFK